jgi:hypothetical protein
VIVVIDEVQEVIRNDQIIREALTRILTMGRTANVFACLLTQHPVVDELGGATIARNLSGRTALLVADATASYVAMGSRSEPRADRLGGRGDGYVNVPGETHRIQVAYSEVADAAAVSGAPPEMAAWPDVQTADLGQPVGKAQKFSPQELAVSVLVARWGNFMRGDPGLHGRPTLRALLKEICGQAAGGERLRQLQAVGRDVVNELGKLGFTIENRAQSDCLAAGDEV